MNTYRSSDVIHGSKIVAIVKTKTGPWKGFPLYLTEEGRVYSLLFGRACLLDVVIDIDTLVTGGEVCIGKSSITNQPLSGGGKIKENDMAKYESKIIGEAGAGMTGLEIHVNGDLFWSHDYFSNGASDRWYKKGLRQIFDDAMACNTVNEWAEFEYDEDGTAIVESLDASSTTWVVATYSPESGWIFSEPTHDGQSHDFIQANVDRIPGSVLKAWAEICDDTHLMNPHSGTVQSASDWNAEAKADGWSMDLANLIEVGQDEEGNWTEK